jgi:hypothetical protein
LLAIEIVRTLAQSGRSVFVFLDHWDFRYGIRDVAEQITGGMNQFKTNNILALLAFWESLTLDDEGFMGQSMR